MCIKMTRRSDYAILHLDRGKVNAINHEMVRKIRQVVAELAGDKSVRGLIIVGKPHYFSAGLDLIELSSYDYHQIRAFWSDFMAMMVDLVKFSKPTIAAITGYSPAGGAVIAITCDHRFMAQGEKYHIGLNEVAVGIIINEGIFRSYCFWLGERQAYQALIEGKLFSVSEALQVGLIDASFPLEELLAAAEQKMLQLLRANDHVLQETKKVMRADWIKAIDIDMEEDLEARSRLWMHPNSQKMIGDIVARLAGG